LVQNCCIFEDPIHEMRTAVHLSHLRDTSVEMYLMSSSGLHGS
jgi:hypothetical protein